MKKIVIILVLFVSNTILGQTVFDKFENQEDVSSIIVNKKMFLMLSKMEVNDAASQQYVNLIKKLDDLKVFVTKNQKITADMKSVSDNYVKSSSLEVLMHETDNDKSANVYVKSDTASSQIKELMMFIHGKGNVESVLMSLSGHFNLNELPVLIDKMKLPGGDVLKKASKAGK